MKDFFNNRIASELMLPQKRAPFTVELDLENYLIWISGTFLLAFSRLAPQCIKTGLATVNIG